MTQHIGSGTAKGLVEYLDSLVDRGRATTGAVTPLKGAFTKVMKTVDGEKWGDTNVREMDVDDYLTRFTNLTIGTYTDDSLRIYATRVKKVLGWYTTFLSKPGWAPTFRQNGKTKQTSVKKAPSTAAAAPKTKPASPEDRTGDDNTGKDLASNHVPKNENNGLIAYPFPLMSGKLVTLYLPVKLDKKDADRLSNYLQTLVVE